MTDHCDHYYIVFIHCITFVYVRPDVSAVVHDRAAQYYRVTEVTLPAAAAGVYVSLSGLALRGPAPEERRIGQRFEPDSNGFLFGAATPFRYPLENSGRQNKTRHVNRRGRFGFGFDFCIHIFSLCCYRGRAPAPPVSAL